MDRISSYKDYMIIETDNGFYVDLGPDYKLFSHRTLEDAKQFVDYVIEESHRWI